MYLLSYLLGMTYELIIISGRSSSKKHTPSKQPPARPNTHLTCWQARCESITILGPRTRPLVARSRDLAFAVPGSSPSVPARRHEATGPLQYWGPAPPFWPAGAPVIRSTGVWTLRSLAAFPWAFAVPGSGPSVRARGPEEAGHEYI